MKIDSVTNKQIKVKKIRKIEKVKKERRCPRCGGPIFDKYDTICKPCEWDCSLG